MPLQGCYRLNEYKVLHKSRGHRHDAGYLKKLALTVVFVKSKQETFGDTYSEKKFRDDSTLIEEG